MNEYLGKTCPFCKTEFAENDDIVVCSTCDMPHHKECWAENQGCSTFGCMGTIKNADGSLSSVTTTEMNLYPENNASGAKVFCTRCGYENTGDSAFCVSCGNKLEASQPAAAPVVAPTPAYNTAYTAPNTYAPVAPQTQPIYQQPAQPTYQPVYQQPAQPVYQQTPYQQPAQPTYQQTPYQQPTQTAYQQTPYQQPAQQTSYQPGFTPAPTTVDPDVAMLIGDKNDYYIPNFLKLKSSDQKITWNWPAFLITPYWFFYRKMYVYGGATLGIVLLLTLIMGAGANLVALLGYIAVGLFGNYIYMLHLEKLAGQMKTMDQFTKQQFAEKNGGVNMGLAIGVAVGYAVIALLFSL